MTGGDSIFRTPNAMVTRIKILFSKKAVIGYDLLQNKVKAVPFSWRNYILLKWILKLLTSFPMRASEHNVYLQYMLLHRHEHILNSLQRTYTRVSLLQIYKKCTLFSWPHECQLIVASVSYESCLFRKELKHFLLVLAIIMENGIKAKYFFST